MVTFLWISPWVLGLSPQRGEVRDDGFLGSGPRTWQFPLYHILLVRLMQSSDSRGVDRHPKSGVVLGIGGYVL